MRVLHLNEHLGWLGGIETYLLSLTPLLVERGHEVLIGYASGDGSLVPRSRQLPLLSHADRRAERECYDQVSRLITEERPDLAHLHNVHDIGAIAACLDSVPTVVTAHDYRYICPTSSLYYNRTQRICERTCGLGCFATTVRHHCLTPRPRYAMRYYRRVRWMMANARRFKCTIAPSSYAAERFVRSGFPRERVRVLPYFCPIEPADRPSPEHTEREPVVLFVGRVTPRKGYECFIRALGLLPATVRGLIVGECSPEQHRQIMGVASRAGCRDRLDVEPWASRQAIRSVYERATVFVFPSLWAETLGIVGLEALACGVPVVASDVGGVREWLRPSETGLLVPPNDSSALAVAVKRLLDDGGLRQTMSRAGADLILRRFAPSEHVDQLLAIYDEVRLSCAPATQLPILDRAI
jgi:glycosyltransferase involved in cell wall biosynthesis